MPPSASSHAKCAPGVCDRLSASTIESLEKNPENGGRPAFAIAPMSTVQYVIGMYLRNPPILRMSCSWCSAMMTEPAPRKSTALKKACVMRWKIATE